MTGGRRRGYRGASRSNSINSGVRELQKLQTWEMCRLPNVECACAMCMASLGDVSIGCSRYNSRYHPTRVCMVLPDSVIDAIKEHGSNTMRNPEICVY